MNEATDLQRDEKSREDVYAKSHPCVEIKSESESLSIITSRIKFDSVSQCF